MPVLNEASSLRSAVGSILAQEYSGTSEVILAVGPSRDGTERIAADLQSVDSRIHVVANPRTDIPTGLNLAIRAATGDVIVRVDAHSELPPGYTATMVAILLDTGAANVGGVMRARGRGPVQAAIARAYNSRFGLGGGVYHGADEAQAADSAYLGVFRSDVLREVGGYDDSIRRGEDYELNQRIRASGHTVWFTPRVEVTYWPRSSWRALAQQMWATGAWRAEIARRGTPTPLRYYAPPTLVTGLLASAGVGAAQLTGLARWPWSIIHLVPLSYGVFLVHASGKLGGETWSARIHNITALSTMHLSWGAGFVRGLLTGASETIDHSRVHRTP